jgi:hypothetical protein
MVGNHIEPIQIGGGVPHLEPLNVLRYLRRADGNGAYSASFSKRPMTPKLGYIQPTGTLIFLEVTTAFHHLNIYIYMHICSYCQTMATLRNDAMDDSVQAALFLGSICTSVPVRVYSIESLYVYIIPGTIYIYI